MKPGSSVMVRPARQVSGSLRLPGDKSISHRYAMLAAIAEGKSRFENYSTGADCASTLACLRTLGVHWEYAHDGANVIEVDGRGPELAAPAAFLDCGNSGSTMRMLSGILAGQDFTSKLYGDESLSRRPMARIVKPLTEMGAQITSAPEERPPLEIHGGHLKAVHYKMPVASAQVKSCLLFAGLYANGERVSKSRCAPGIMAKSRCGPSAPNSSETEIRPASRAARDCMPSRRAFRVTSRARLSFFARRRCFRARSWWSTRF